MSTVIRVENLSKRYRLGVINRRMLYEDLQSRWARWRGKDDPNAKVDARRTTTHAELWALKDVEFEVRDGDVLGVIGHNGSGKSTLLKILSQITAPTTGRALIKGKVASLLEVGTGFHPELTGRDNVFLNGVILGMRHEEVARKFDEIVAFSGVEEFIDTPVKRYSSGMRVRLAFAVAAHLDPEILIIDEVLAVGDQSFQQKCLGKIGEVAREGRTVLFVSHNAAAVENLCDRGIVLEHGRLIFTGTQSEAIQYYVNREDHSDNSNLAERTDRSGTGDVRIVGLNLRGERGEPITTASAGRAVEIHLLFENLSGKPFPNLMATIHVRTHFDAPVFIQQNRLTGDSFGALPERGALVCRLPRLPLPASVYRVGFSLNSEGKGGQVLDSILHAVDLPVETGDFFGTGLLPPVLRGVCLVEAEWRLEAQVEAAAV
ncbi:MAG: lipopolysaccharide transport system ATP-binding protein [Chthoniobacter sp.]|jgi:lipopolysaccharide transport system ATP-binding protein|nr:lipopolysaccharide transport system ATP-binding protein [Chthoniobacter sp.]